MYRFSSYDIPGGLEYPGSEEEILISNEIGMDFSYRYGRIQYGYGLFCGYIQPNKINPLVNAGVGLAFPPYENGFYLGAKLEVPVFYKLYFERTDNPYLSQKRSWIGGNIKATAGANVFGKVKVEGQISYLIHTYSIGIGYAI